MTYLEAYEIAGDAAKAMDDMGYKFAPGATRIAALSAIANRSASAQHEAMISSFLAMRVSINPRWDGSIA